MLKPQLMMIDAPLLGLARLLSPVQSRKLSVVVAKSISRYESRRSFTTEILQRGWRRFASDL
ncbi:hypothetical protein GCM10027565_21980 [Bordetella tumulicola]